MHEYIIHLPKRGNDLRSLIIERKALRRAIVEAFGGITSYDAKGAWVSPSGKLYEEPVEVIRVAAPDDSEALGMIVRIARKAAQVMKQECVYVVAPSGVLFVEPEEAPLMAAAQ